MQVSNLSVFTQYHVQVAALTSRGSGPYLSAIMSSAEAACATMATPIVEVLNVSSRLIKISWISDPESAGGVVIEFGTL